MIVVHEMRRRARSLIAQLLGLTITSYFVYHVFEGDRGLAAWRDIVQELHTAQDKLSAVQAERAVLARRVAGLDPAHVDPDLLDQQVRANLNLIAPDEIEILGSRAHR